MQNYSDKYVACPFYSQESGSKIRCEGFAEDNSLQTTFETKELLKAHKRRFCYCISKHREGPLYPIINQKYKENDDEQIP